MYVKKHMAHEECIVTIYSIHKLFLKKKKKKN